MEKGLGLGFYFDELDLLWSDLAFGFFYKVVVIHKT